MREAIDVAARRLAEAGCETPRLDARVLLSHVTGWNEAQLVVRDSNPLAPEAETRFMDSIERRARREPVAYITGEKEFFSLPFVVDARVLVPRPETEHVVEHALEILRARLDEGAGETLRVIDVGTGSGAIAITLAHELARSAREAGVRLELIGLDRSRAALEVASENATRLLAPGFARPTARVQLLRANLLDAIGTETADLVISNPPYLTTSELAAAAPELHFEPRISLDGGTVDGLGVVEKLLAGAARVLRRGGTVLSEIGAGQARRAIELAHEAGLEAAVVATDLAGKARILLARRTSSAA